MKYTYEEYMDIKGIKSRDILEKYIEDGIVEKIKEEDVVYIVDNHDNKDKNDFIDEIKSINFELDNQMKNMNILNKKMDFLGKNIDYFATIEIPTLSRNCFGESPTSFLKYLLK